MRKTIHLTLLWIAILCVSSCVRYDAEEFDGMKLPRRSGYINGITNDWIYYNLRTKKIFNRLEPSLMELNDPDRIREGSQYDRLDWDLAFCGFTLRTNSGTSGKGKGGAADLGYGNYQKWKKVSQLPKDLKWVIDTDDVVITMAEADWKHYCIENNLPLTPWFDPNHGPKRTTTSANMLLAHALRFSGPPPVYTPSFHTYVVRTADGEHYYKLQIVSWFNAKTEIGDKGGEISFYCHELENDAK